MQELMKAASVSAREGGKNGGNVTPADVGKVTEVSWRGRQEGIRKGILTVLVGRTYCGSLEGKEGLLRGGEVGGRVSFYGHGVRLGHYKRRFGRARGGKISPQAFFEASLHGGGGMESVRSFQLKIRRINTETPKKFWTVKGLRTRGIITDYITAFSPFCNQAEI